MSRVRALVAALAVTQTVGYGCLYYSFAVLLAPVAAELHASRTAVTGAFTAAVLAGAVLAVPVGRWLDRHGAHGLMTIGSLLGSGLLAALSLVHDLVAFYLIWAGLGAVGAMVLYEAAFATVIARTSPARRAGALLAVTVVAGFASTIFLPLTGFLVEEYGWRTAVLLLAAGHAVITVPLHALAVRRPPRTAADVVRPGDDPSYRDTLDRDALRRERVRRAVRDGRFWLLAVAFTAQSAATSTMTLHLIGFLVSAGHPATVAATVGGLLGVLSVTGRLVVTGLQRRYRITGVVAVVFGVQAVAAVLLPLLAGTLPGAVIGVVGYGIGFGVGSIARPALLTHLFGTTGYASLAGRLAVPITLATAGAPLATAALLRASGSYVPVLVAIAGFETVAAVSVAGIARGASRSLQRADVR